MTSSFRPAIALGLFLTIAASARGVAQSPAPAPRTPAEQAKADGGKMPYTAADVQFMQGMIGHHSQAVIMGGWAATHGANAGLQILAQRIVVSQRDEIAFMQRWLRDRNETVPDPAAKHDMAGMAGMAGHDMGPMLMPGMLTPEQMAELDRARGADFDRLFLTFMIQHHRGALTMVDKLFDSPGGGQELYVFRFASDVGADQTSEIDRMQSMLSSPH
jgi:uncharacterized protein (DUF305 family)